MSPMAPPRKCSYPGCWSLIRGVGVSRCPQHPYRRWDNRLTAAARGYGSEWRKTRARILERDGYRCILTPTCGAPAVQVDHLVPKVRGGGDNDSNLASACKACHDRKSALEGLAARRRS